MARRADQLRAVAIQRRFPTAAAGSVLIRAGKTRVLCTAALSAEPPKWLEKADPPHGWVTAEYSMLPASTPDRKRRGPDSRSTEIQRLIGRALRASVDLSKMPGVLITCDCDVLYADGGTRTAAVTGAYVALADAVKQARADGLIQRNPLIGPVAGVSVGVVSGKVTLDLDYEQDVAAEVDMNVVMNYRGQFVEVQGTGEHGTFDRQQLDRMLDTARRGIRKLIALQRKTLGGR